MFKSYRILELLCHSQQMESSEPYFTRTIEPQLFESDCGENSIHFPLPDSAPLTEQVIFTFPIGGVCINGKNLKP